MRPPQQILCELNHSDERPSCILPPCWSIARTLAIALAEGDEDSSFRTLVRPAKAGMFSGRQSHRGNSQDPVAWVAFAEETKRMKPTDKAILGMVSESPGRNASEPGGGLDRK